MSIFNFLGQNSATVDKDEMYDPKTASAYGQVCSMLVGRDGKLDSRYIGTGIKVVDTSTYGYCLHSFTWRAYDGNTYTFMYCRLADGTCSLIYTVNETWASLVQPAAAKWYDDQDTPVVLSAIPFMPPQTLPGFATDPDGSLYIALGVSGVYRVEVRAGVLYFYQTHIPLTSFLLMDAARSWSCPADLPDMGWSAVGDVARYTPKPVEMEADPPTYGVDYHAQFAFFGLKGSQTIGTTVFGRAKVAWTEDDCFMIFGTGGDGQTQFAKIGDKFGLAGFLSYNEFGDILYWFSTYNGGSYLGATYGAAPQGTRVLGHPIAIGNNYAITVFDAGHRIADVLKAAGKMTTKIKKVAWGEYQDWKNIPTTQRAGLDIDLEHGTVSLGDATAKVTYTPSAMIRRTFGGLGTITFDGTYTAAKLSDADPLYPATAYVDNTKYALINVAVASGTIDTMTPMLSLGILDAAGNSLMVNGHRALAGNKPLAWEKIKFDRIVTTSGLIVRGECKSNGTMYGGFTILFDIILDFGAIKAVSGINLYDIVKTLTSTTNLQIKIGEIEVYGASSATGTLYTEACVVGSKGVLTGLTISSARDLGVFFARFVGNGSNYIDDVTISIRCGTVALAAYDTTSPANTWTDWYTLSDREKKRGKALRDLTFKTSGTQLLASSGGLLYVQAMAVLAVNAQGISPELDFMVFTAVTGDNITSVFPCSHNDDHQFLSFKGTTSSTGNDKEACRSILGAWSVVATKAVTSYLSLAAKTIMAFSGYAGAMQHAGRYCYIGATSTLTNLLGRFLTPQLVGRLQGKSLSVGIENYTESTLGDPGTTVVTGDVDSITAQTLYSGDALDLYYLEFEFTTNTSAKYWVSFANAAGTTEYLYFDALDGDTTVKLSLDTITAAIRQALTVIKLGICDEGGAAWIGAGSAAISTTWKYAGLRSVVLPTNADYLTVSGIDTTSDPAAASFTLSGVFRYGTVNAFEMGRRYLNATNYVRLSYGQATAGKFLFQAIVGGVTKAYYESTAAYSYTSGDQIIYSLTRSGTTVSLTVNGVNIPLTVTTAIGVNSISVNAPWKCPSDGADNDGMYYDNLKLIISGVTIFDNQFEYVATITATITFGMAPLQILATKDSNTITRYNSISAITNLQKLPKSQSFQAGNNSAAAKLSVDVKSYSGFRLDSIEFSATDTSYR